MIRRFLGAILLAALGACESGGCGPFEPTPFVPLVEGVFVRRTVYLETGELALEAAERVEVNVDRTANTVTLTFLTETSEVKETWRIIGRDSTATPFP